MSDLETEVLVCPRDCLIPLHVDGDGHCLVHAVSRAIVGRELFWHALRTGLKLHLKENLPQYKVSDILAYFFDSVKKPKSPKISLAVQGAFDSAINHKRQRRKRQSVTAKPEVANAKVRIV